MLLLREDETTVLKTKRRTRMLYDVIRARELGGSGWGGTNVSCQLKFWPFVSCQLNLRPFVSCQLTDC